VTAGGAAAEGGAASLFLEGHGVTTQSMLDVYGSRAFSVWSSLLQRSTRLSKVTGHFLRLF